MGGKRRCSVVTAMVCTLVALPWANPGAAGAQALHPQWSPTGYWIAYYQRTEDRASLFIVHPDGTGRVGLTAGADYDANPTWGPGGHEIAFARGIGGMRETWDIFVLDVGAERLRRLTDTPEREVHTSWSPDGRWIAFVQLGDGVSDLFIMRPDGSDARRITDTPWREFHPKWSPDSRRLIYDAGDDSARNIWSVDIETGEATALTDVEPGRSATAPSWSPDGTRFAYSMRAGDGPERLVISDLDGSDVRVLDLGGLNGGAPYWSPDGDSIAFHASVDDTWAVYVVAADGGEVVKISD